ncbi:MAG: nuclear transport factor 2 family protein [Cyanobacteria bacterium P01_H01_bin.105]
MTEREKRDLIKRYLNAYNTFDVDGMMATVDPEIQFENVSEGEINASAYGVDEFRQMAKQATALFSSRCQTVTAYRMNPKGVSVDIAYEGVLATDLFNGMKAGQTLKLNGRSEFEFKAGKIVRIVDYS